jgi:hypothetical protein
MTLPEYLLNVVLVGLVFLQMRGRPLTVRNLVLPLVITAWVASQFLHGLPTSGNDLTLEMAGAMAGVALGLGAGAATRVLRQGQRAVAKAGMVAAALWVVGIGGRVAFSLWVTHGGQASVVRFSANHHITSGAAWAAAFILMAIAEVASRTGVLFVKARRSGAVIDRGRVFGPSAA